MSYTLNQLELDFSSEAVPVPKELETLHEYLVLKLQYNELANEVEQLAKWIYEHHPDRIHDGSPCNVAINLLKEYEKTNRNNTK